MRMSMRRLARLTNGFSKKLANHEHALVIYFMYYNVVRIHSTLRVTPAIEAGISDHVWTLEEIAGLVLTWLHGSEAGKALMNTSCRSGFTLTELSIVLVIIGLVVGAVLVGRDLIGAAEVRAQISQIGKYTAAVNAFRLKYNCLPGDCLQAADFGFAARGQYQGEGDGNELLEGVYADNATNHAGWFETAGETVMFWKDLSQAGLIDGSFSIASPNVAPGADVTSANVPNYLPAAKIGKGNYVYVYSASTNYPLSLLSSSSNIVGLSTGNVKNAYGISAVTGMNMILNAGTLNGATSISVQQAYNIDQKIDDGLPLSGNVLAVYSNQVIPACLPICGVVPGSASSCWDNNGNAAITMHYSTEISGGSGPNCGLSFLFN